MHLSRLVLIVAGLLVLLTACAQPAPEETPTPTPTITPAPEQPTPAPTGTPPATPTTAPAPAVTPTPETAREQLLARIESLPEGHFLVGQWGIFGDGHTPETADEHLEELYEMTGHYPAMTGADFGAVSATPQEVTDWLIDKHREGYIVAASYHMRNPVTGGWVDDTDLGGQTLCDIPENEAYQEDVEALAGYLQQLEDAGVVLLWRPFHEMNGSWFWWGFENHDDCFDDLWRDLYTRLVDEHGLDNLLWIYSPNAPTGDGSRDFLMSGYPGDEYVDIVGLDKYGACHDDPLDLDIGYDELLETGKPFMLNEFGGRDTGPSELDEPCSLQDILDGVAEHYPEVKGIMFWEWVWALSSDDYTGQRAFMNHSAVLSRDDPAWERAGRDSEPNP